MFESMSYSKSFRRCAYIYCNSVQDSTNYKEKTSFFKFPEDPLKCASWIEKCNPNNLPSVNPTNLHKSYKLCGLHFVNSMFSNFQKNRLYPHATPTLFDKYARKNSSIESRSCQHLLLDDSSHSITDHPLHCSTSDTSVSASIPSSNYLKHTTHRSSVLKSKNCDSSIYLKESNIPGGGPKKYTINLKKWKLKKGTIQSITIISNKSKPEITNNNKICTIHKVDVLKEHDYFDNSLLNVRPLSKLSNTPNKINLKRCKPKKKEIQSILVQSDKIKPVITNNCKISKINKVDVLKDHDYYNTSQLDIPLVSKSFNTLNKVNSEVSLYHIISEKISSTNIPKNWLTSTDNNCISFHKLSPFQSNFMRYVEKQLVVTENLDIIVHINNKTMTPIEIGMEFSEVNSIATLLQLLIKIDKINICIGAGSSVDNLNIKKSLENQHEEFNGQWRHINCLTILKDSKQNICHWCKLLFSQVSNQLPQLNKSIAISKNQEKN